MKITKLFRVYRAVRKCLSYMQQTILEDGIFLPKGPRREFFNRPRYTNVTLQKDGTITAFLCLPSGDSEYLMQGNIVLDTIELEKRFDDAQEFLKYIGNAIENATYY